MSGEEEQGDVARLALSSAGRGRFGRRFFRRFGSRILSASTLLSPEDWITDLAAHPAKKPDSRAFGHFGAGASHFAREDLAVVSNPPDIANRHRRGP
jgi:hypothetical protein